MTGRAQGSLPVHPRCCPWHYGPPHAPKRTRYIRFPLQCTDKQLDRNNNPVGYDGFGYDRLKDLEDWSRSVV